MGMVVVSQGCLSQRKVGVKMKSLDELKVYADDHRIPYETLMDIIRREVPPVGDNPEFVSEHNGWRVVFSIENQPAGLTRHMSMSGGDWSKINADSFEVAKKLGINPEHPFSVYVERHEEISLNVIQVFTERLLH